MENALRLYYRIGDGSWQEITAQPEDNKYTAQTQLEDLSYTTGYQLEVRAEDKLQSVTKTITLGTRTFTNHNKLLWRYEGCVGMKTGYTEKAGRTLVSAATRDGMTLVCVTLNDPNDWSDHAALFDYGFAGYRVERLTQQGAVLARMPTRGSLVPFCPVAAGEELSLCLREGERVERTLEWNTVCLEGPLKVGTPVGEAVFYCNGGEAARIPLVTGTAVADDLAPPENLLARLWPGD